MLNFLLIDSGNANVTLFLIGRGANVNATDEFENFPIQLAAKQGTPNLFPK